jgi:hypothetical protein
MPITLRGVRSVRGGSIEAIRWPWRSTGGRCPIPCKTPEPHGPMRTMEVRTRTRIRSRAEVRGPTGGFGFAWRDLSLPSRRQGLIATRPPSNIFPTGSFLFTRSIAAKISGLSRAPDRRPDLPCIKFGVASNRHLLTSSQTLHPYPQVSGVRHGQSVKADHISDRRRAARDGSREVRGSGGPFARTGTAGNPEKSSRLQVARRHEGMAFYRPATADLAACQSIAPMLLGGMDTICDPRHSWPRMTNRRLNVPGNSSMWTTLSYGAAPVSSRDWITRPNEGHGWARL